MVEGGVKMIFGPARCRLGVENKFMKHLPRLYMRPVYLTTFGGVNYYSECMGENRDKTLSTFCCSSWQRGGFKPVFGPEV